MKISFHIFQQTILFQIQVLQKYKLINKKIIDNFFVKRKKEKKRY